MSGKKLVTDTIATISKFDLKLGSLVVISLPEHLDGDGLTAVTTGIGEWWITTAPYFLGAKLLICQPGVVVGVQTDESLRQLGYVRLEETLGLKEEGECGV